MQSTKICDIRLDDYLQRSRDGQGEDIPPSTRRDFTFRPGLIAEDDEDIRRESVVLSRGNLKDSFIYEEDKNPFATPCYRECGVCRTGLENLEKSAQSMVKLGIYYFNFLKRILKKYQKVEGMSSVIKTYMLKRASALHNFKEFGSEANHPEHISKRFRELGALCQTEVAETESFLKIASDMLGLSKQTQIIRH